MSRHHRAHPTRFRVDETAAIDISAVADQWSGEAEVTLTIDAGPMGALQLTGNGWDLHKLVIDIDRQLTRLSRQSPLGSAH